MYFLIFTCFSVYVPKMLYEHVRFKKFLVIIKMDAISLYMAQFGSDSDSDDDEGYDPNKHKKEMSKNEEEESDDEDFVPTKKVKETKEQENKHESVEETKAPQPEVNEKEKEQKQEIQVPQTTTETAENKDNVVTLDNDAYIPVKKLTDEEKKASTLQINNYFASILGGGLSDDEEEDEDDAEYTELTVVTKEKKKENAQSEVKQPESDTEPIKSSEIIDPLTKLIEDINGCDNASDALIKHADNIELLNNITSNATKLLFMGFSDIYDQKPENLQNIVNDLKAKLENQ